MRNLIIKTISCNLEWMEKEERENVKMIVHDNRNLFHSDPHPHFFFSCFFYHTRSREKEVKKNVIISILALSHGLFFLLDNILANIFLAFVMTLIVSYSDS
jgi:hypothetical protein